MSDKDNDKNIIQVPNKLKERAGDGGELPTLALKEAQMFMANNDIDFKPMATSHLKEIDTHFVVLKEAKTKAEKEFAMAKIIENIMQIKAHGGMFHYQIMSDIANIVLQLLEVTTDYNAALYQIIEAHNNSIRIIIKRNISGDGGMQGKEITDELNKAIKRYQTKYK